MGSARALPIMPSCETKAGPSGVAAIKQWMRDAKKKYQHRVEPIEVVKRDGKTVVTARNFPNSPVNLDHIFGIEGDRIASLEIRW
jgi:hypothetical protein